MKPLAAVALIAVPLLISATAEAQFLNPPATLPGINFAACCLSNGQCAVLIPRDCSFRGGTVTDAAACTTLTCRATITVAGNLAAGESWTPELLSGDGRTLVGRGWRRGWGSVVATTVLCRSNSGWSPNHAYDSLTTPTGISADGGILVGTSNNRAYAYFTATGERLLLYGMPGAQTFGRAVSPDGQWIAGAWTYGEYTGVARWRTSDGTFENLTDSHLTKLQASRAITNTGLIAGFYRNAHNQKVGFVGPTTTGDLLMGATDAEMQFVSASGSVAFGYGTVTGGKRPTRWTAAAGLENISGIVPPAPTNAAGFSALSTNGINGVGSIAVGEGETSAGKHAFIWTETGRVMKLRDYLRTRFPATNLGTLRFDTAVGISSNGRVIAGFDERMGSQPQRVWIITLPQARQ